MRDDADPVGRHAVAALQYFGASRGHDDGPVGASDQRLSTASCSSLGFFEHGMEGDDQRQAGRAGELKDVAARRAAENAKFMLQPDRLGAARLDPLGGFAIGGRIVGIDRDDMFGVADAGPVIHRIMVEFHCRVAAAKRVGDITGISRQSASARQRVADQRQMPERRRRRPGGNPLVVVNGQNIIVEHQPRLPSTWTRRPVVRLLFQRLEPALVSTTCSHAHKNFFCGAACRLIIRRITGLGVWGRSLTVRLRPRRRPRSPMPIGNYSRRAIL